MFLRKAGEKAAIERPEWFGLDGFETIRWSERQMKAKITALLALVCLVGFTGGCYSTVSGHTKVGIPLVRDRIVSRYERPVDQVFQAAKQTLQANGTLVAEDTINQVLTAKVDNTTVWVKVQEVEPGVTEVVTQARTRGSAPDITVAAEIDKQIALRLQAMQ